MSRAKLITLVVLGALAWQHQALLQDKIELARHLPELTNTYMEMRTYRVRLAREMRSGDGRRPPDDFSGWLRRHFDNPAKADPAVDHFGNLYRLELRRPGGPGLRSCGPDGVCGNEDDLVMTI